MNLYQKLKEEQRLLDQMGEIRLKNKRNLSDPEILEQKNKVDSILKELIYSETQEVMRRLT